MAFANGYPHYINLYHDNGWDHRTYPGVLIDLATDEEELGQATVARVILGSIKDYRREGREALKTLRFTTNPEHRERLKAEIRFKFARASYLFLAWKTR